MRKPKVEKGDKNKSPVDWYVASVLLRFEWDDENQDNPNRRCMAWENQIIIKARNPEEAYAKAMKHGESGEKYGEMCEANNEDKTGRWRFEGLTSLLPIYDELEDGAEITWKQYKNKSVKKVKSRVRSKGELEVFNTH